MARTLIVCVLVALTPGVRAADTKPETVIRLTVQPMAAPKPALKYQLLPELREMEPGNPIQGYLKCFMMQHNFFHGKEAVANRQKWLTMPLASLPVKDLRDLGRIPLQQADRAARLETPDWQVLLVMRQEGTHILLPDIAPLRNLADALKVRFRVAVAERRFDDGIANAKTMFALSRHLGAHPTLIGNLVGIAVANVTLGPLEEMLQQPGCPNLYWALTELPSPLIDLRRGLQGERVIEDSETMLDDRAVMSAEQLEKAVKRVSAMYEVLGLKYVDQDDGGKETPREWLQSKAKNAIQVKAARTRLAAGSGEKTVAGFPALQVVLLDEKRAFEDARDDRMKGLLLPYWQSEPLLAAARTKHIGGPLFRPIVPYCMNVRKAQARLDQQIALLRHVEALRVYAADHEGGLPETLADVKLPLPVDPFTGKPFLYKKEGSKAILRGTPPHREEKNAAYNLRFEVVIKP